MGEYGHIEHFLFSLIKQIIYKNREAQQSVTRAVAL